MGGGSVAALTGALGAALVSMVSNLTLGKEKYKDVQPRIEALLKESETLRAEMQALIQKDTEVYGALSDVYKMPKNTDAEKAAALARDRTHPGGIAVPIRPSGHHNPQTAVS